MGLYIDPEGISKEDWLAKKGIMGVFPPSRLDELGRDFLPVCLVNNGHFTAAGIAHNEDELEAFKNPEDTRPKTWYYVEIKDLVEVQPKLEKYL